MYRQLSETSRVANNYQAARLARERDELSARKRRQEENADHELEQCLIAYHVHRVDGGQMTWPDFRREWYMTRGAKDGG